MAKENGGFHRGVLLWASFLTLIAAGMGFAIRGNILGDWQDAFGFTMTELGTITGGGLVGFGVIIILSSLFVDRIGYKPLLILAFLLHLLSAILTVAATPVYAAYGKDTTYWLLYVGMFMFAVANGLCEAVINPLVAQLYPKEKTHYLNILHAGWPGGLIVGAVFAYLFAGNTALVYHLRWEVPMLFFMVPVVIYGVMILREKFPASHALEAGVSVREMLLQFAAPVLLFLFLLHAMVGYVELGTDSWIQDILKSVISGYAVLLFIYTSAIMFVLRFFAGPIVEKINPVGLLFCSAVLAAVGLSWLGVAGAGWAILIAATIYGIGKTFFWPTMLGVVGERFPRGGALTMGTIGGIGMLSAGLLGGPGIGYKQDLNASAELKETAPQVYQEYVAKGNYSEKLGRFVNENEMVDGKWPASFGNVVKKPEPKAFLFFPETTALDGKKVAEIKDKKQAGKALTPDEEKVFAASLYGGQTALLWTAAVPATMAVGYLILIIYFRSIGGYRQEELSPGEGEKYLGGVEGPMEA